MEIINNVDYCLNCNAIYEDLNRFEDEGGLVSDEERELAISLYGYDWWRYV